MSVKLAVVPVAGRGTRLLPLTKSQPKEMLPVGRKPVVQYVVEELADCGINRLLFITGSGKTAIENHFDLDVELTEHLRVTGKEDLLLELQYERFKIEYFYTRQRQQLGLGHAILCSEPIVGENESFVVALGDSILGVDSQSRVVSRMMTLFEEKKADAVISFESVSQSDVSRYGIASMEGKMDEETGVFLLKEIIEKPSVEEAPSNLAVSGRYIFTSRIFHYLHQTLPGKNGEIQLTDAIQALISDGGKVYGVSVKNAERRFDIGNFHTYYAAFMEFALSDRIYGAELRKKTREILSRYPQE